MDRQSARNELRQAKLTFRQLLDNATVAELKDLSDGTKWTNEELLFHMYFGYLIVLRLRVQVLAFGRLPNTVSRVFSGALEAATKPFHLINYLASVIGDRILGPSRLGPAFDRVVDRLLRRLDTDSDSDMGA